MFLSEAAGNDIDRYFTYEALSVEDCLELFLLYCDYRPKNTDEI